MDALAVSGSTVYAGGVFTSIGGTARNRLAAIGTDGTLASWDPNASNTQMSAIVASDSSVYVGGTVGSVGPYTTRNRLLALTSAGELADWNPNANGTVQALAINGSTVYAGGAFTTVGGAAHSRVVKIGTDGTVDSWNADLFSGQVNALAVNSSRLYAGGTFTAASGSPTGGQAKNRLASWNTSDMSLATGFTYGVQGTVFCMTLTSDYLIIGGQLTSVGVNNTLSGSLTTGGLAAFQTSDDTLVTGWYPKAYTTATGTTVGSVYALAASPPDLFIGGTFASIRASGSSSNSPNNGLADYLLPTSLSAAGGMRTSWQPNINGSSKPVRALTISGTNLYAGGDFTAVGGTFKVSTTTYGSATTGTRNHLAAWSIKSLASTTLLPWDPNAGTTNTTYALASDPDVNSAPAGVIYAGGNFLGVADADTNTANYASVNYRQKVTITASSPSAITYGTAVPSITYTVSSTTPTTVTGDWTTQPSCGIYASSDTTFATALTGSNVAAGTYVTHCTGGDSTKVYVGSRVDGSLTINKTATTVTAASPSNISSTTAVPTITYTTSPSTSASDWTSEPTCAVYASSDTTFATPLTGTQAQGTYVTHCSGGSSAGYNPTSYVDGSLVVGPVAYTVTNCLDSGTGSLRDGLAQVATGGTISFDVSCSTITPLTTLHVSRNMTINGPTSAGLAIDGGSTALVTGNFRQNMMWVDGGVSATIRNLTFQNGIAVYGGAIYAQGGTSSSAYTNLRVENSTFKNNAASFGGAIDSADANVDGGSGPAYYGPSQTHKYGNLTVINSTFANNSTSTQGDGGAIDHGEYGGYGTLTILGSTFVGNSSDYGVIDVCDDLTYGPHPTVCTADAFVGGSVFANPGNQPSVPATKTKEANSDPTYGAVIPVDLGYNISDDNSFGFSAESTSVNSSTTIGASLAALADNGGPTWTVLPSAMSPAVAAIPGSTSVTVPASNGVASAWNYQLCSRTDQRGVATGGNGRCTIGAVDVLVKANVTVTAASPSSVNSATSVPSVGYTTSPSTVAGDWTVEPSCAVYASSDTGFATPLTGAQAVGTYVTHCSGGSSTNYNPTPFVNGSLVVTSASTNVTVTASSPSSVDSNTAVPSVGYSTSPSTVAGDWTVEPSCAVYSTSDTTFASPLSGQHSAGTYVTHCSGGSSAGYNPTSYVDGSLTVTQYVAPKTSVVVTAADSSITYGASILSVGYSTSPSTVAGDWTSEPSCAVYSQSDSSFASPLSGQHSAGSYVTHCSGGSSSAYSPTSYVDGTLTINKASSSTVITCPTAHVTYTGSAQTPCSAVVSGAGGLSTTASVTYGANTDAGSATANASFAGDANHDGSSASQSSFVIDQASSTTTVTCSPKTTTYSGSAQTLCSAAVTGVGGLNLTDLTPSYTSNTSAGTSTASYSFVGDVNHSASQGSDTFSIDPATVVVTADSPSLTYGDVIPSVGYSTSPSTVAGDWTTEPVCSVYSTSDTTFASPLTGIHSAGSYVTHCSSGVSANYTTTVVVDGSLTIYKAASTTVVTCPSAVTYTGSFQTPCSAKVTGVQGLDTTTTVDYHNNRDTGSGLADATYVGDANHMGSDATQVSFTIDKAASSTVITCPTVNETYDGGAHTPCSAAVTGAGLSTTATVIYASNTDAGTALADASYDGDSNHTSSTAAQSSFTIDQATSTTTVTCSVSSVTYDGSAQTPCSAQVTGAGGLSQSLDVQYAPNTDAGSVTVSASYQGDPNHSQSSDSSSFTIDQATSTTVVTCSVSSVTYDGSAQTPCSAQVTGAGGLSQSLDVQYSPNTDAGSVSASASFVGDPNHTPSNDASGFTVDQATSTTTVTCLVSSVTYDGSAQAPCSASVTGAGGLSQSLDVQYSPNTDAGSVSASASFVGDPNHTPSNDASGFTIDQVSSTVQITCPLSVAYDGNAQAPCSAQVTGAGGLSQAVDVNYSPNTDAGPVSVSANYPGDPNHQSSGDTSGFTIDQASSTTTVTCPSAHETFDGSTHTPCSASVTGVGGLSQSLDVVYSSNTDAGTAGAGASFGGDQNHAASFNSASFVIDQASSTTTVTCPSNVTYDGGAQAPCSALVEGAGGLSQAVDVTYASNTDAGFASAQANFGGDANHAASDGSSSFVIDPASSTTTVTCSPKSTTYSGIAQGLCSASVTGVGGLNLTGLTPSYSSNTNTGTVTASYTFAGDGNHAGSDGSDTFSIDPSSVVVTPSSPTITYGASVPGITYTTSPVTVAGDWTTEPVCGVYASADTTFTTPVTGVVGAGSYVTHCSNGVSSNYTTISSVPGTLTVSKAASATVVTCSPSSVTYNGSALTPCSAAVTGAGGLSTSVSVSYGANTNAGTATADASYAGDSNHNGSTATQVPFTIVKAASATVITCDASYVYTGSAIENCSAAVTGAGGLSSSEFVSYSTDHTNVGSVAVDAAYSGDANHDGSTATTVYFSITKADTSTLVTCPTAHETYDGAAHTPCSAQVTGAALSASTSVTYGANTNAGTATADASFAGDSNHNGSTATQSSFVIDKASSSTLITCPLSSVTFNGSAQTPCSAAVTGAGGLSTTVPVTYGANTNAGTATADASYSGDANHNGSTATQSSFVIDKAASSTVITCSPSSVTYNGSAQTPCGATAAVTGAGGLSTTVSVSYGANTNAGTATADASYAGDSNHNGSTATQATFTITKAASTTVITCAPSYVYTGSAIENCTAAVTGAGGLSTSVTPSYSADHTNVGSVNVNASYAGDANHNGSSATQVSFAITKASSTTTITCPSSVTYNAAAQTPCSAAAVGAGGLSTTATVVYASNVNAGTATANASYAGDGNHDGSTATQVAFSIAKASVVVNAPIVNITYNTAIPAVGFSTTLATVASDWTTVPTCGVYAPLGVVALTGVQPAGTYETRCSGGVSANFAISSYVKGSLTIAQAPTVTTITCTSPAYTGAALVPCSVSVTGAGLTTITGTPTYANNINAGTNTASASYSYAGDANHAASSSTVYFSIVKASVSVTFTCSVTTTPYTGVAITPCGTTAAVTAVGGLSTTVPVTYANNTNAGTATVTAVYAGTSNYGAVTASKTFTISKAPSTATITCTGTSFVYTAAAITPCSVAITSVGLSTTATPTYTNNTNVGTATAAYTYAGDTNHASVVATAKTFTITKANSVTTVTCPTTPSTYTGAAIAACTAKVTAPGVNSTVTPTYTSNTNPGTATAAYAYAGTTNVNASSGSATFTIVAIAPTIVYTGTQIANTATTSTLTLSSTTSSTLCTGALTYSLDRNPTTGAAGAFLLSASPVNTAGWRDGVYVMTTARAASTGCAAVSDSSSVVTIAATTNRAYGGGKYTVTGTPAVSVGWFIAAGTTTAATGQFQFIQNNTWKYVGALTTYTKTGTTGVSTGTGTLSYWNTTTKAWVSVGSAIPVSITYTNGSAGTLATTFTYTPKTGEPALPTTAAQKIGTTIKVG